MSPRSGIGATVLVLIGVSGTTALGVCIGRFTTATPLQSLFFWTFATFVFGLLVGLSEILSRYRDEPLLAASTNFGLAYLSLNGLVSLAAFMLLRRYPTQIFPSLQNDLLLSSIVAGFGAMVVFRSKLFTFRSSDGKDYPIGPAIVLDTVLKTIDSKIDRRRATERQLEVFRSVIGIQNFSDMADYFEASLSSFQNLSQDDKSEIKTVIDQYRSLTGWPDTLKCLGLGFAFLTIAGDENYAQVMVNLKAFIANQNPAGPPPAPAGPPPAPAGPPPAPAGPPPAPAGPPPAPAGGAPDGGAPGGGGAGGSASGDGTSSDGIQTGGTQPTGTQQ